MADEKPKPEEKDWFVETVPWVLGLFLVGTLIMNITTIVNNDPLFRNGWQGLTATNAVLAYTRSVDSLDNPIGAHIITTHDGVSVLNDAGGSKIGSQKFDANGVITQGPVQVGGINYYYVQFAKSPSGWVAEGDLAYPDQSPSLTARIIIVFWLLISVSIYILIALAILILFFIVKTVRNLTAVRVNNRAKLYPVQTDTEKLRNPAWQRVLTHIDSVNENDWKLAVIEADIMLSELLDTMQLPGDTMADKLQAVEKSDFRTLDLAWEGHKVRNQIAHSPAFHLSQREGKRVIDLYQKVFEEFQLI